MYVNPPNCLRIKRLDGKRDLPFLEVWSKN